MDYIKKLNLQTEEVKEVEALEKHIVINNNPISVNKYNGHTREFLAIDGDYNDGYKQLNEVNGLAISCIVSKEVKEAREDVNGVFHTKLKDRLDSEVNEIKSSLDSIAINVKNFGAIGNGVNDDIGAIESAINYALENNIKNIYIPPTEKEYRITRAIKVYSGLNIFGKNTVINCDDGNYASSGIGYACFINTNEDNRLKDITLDGFTIKCNRKPQHGIYIFHPKGADDITVKNCVIYNPQWDGVIIQGSITQEGGNVFPWTKDGVIKRVLIQNVKCFNENTSEKTRIAFMCEQLHDVVYENCYATGFNTGFHIEGSSDVSYVSCIAEDNNNDWQRADNTNYGSDFMLGRSSNVSLVNCVARRYKNPTEMTYSDNTKWTYKNIYMPSPFQDGLKITNCSFIGGEIRGNEASTVTDRTRFGQGFENCNFDNVSLVFIRQGTEQFFEGLSFINNSFKNSILQANYCKGLNIQSNIFVNTNNRQGVFLSSCELTNIIGNTFKGGCYENSTVAKKCSLYLDSCHFVTINSNSFLDDEVNKTLYSIGFMIGSNITITSNVFNKITDNAIKNTYGTVTKNVIITNNICTYSGEESLISSLNDSTNYIFNNIVNGVLKSPLQKVSDWVLFSIPQVTIPSNTTYISENIVFNGAKFGQHVIVSAPFQLNGLVVNAYVLQDNRVKITITNVGSSEKTISSGDWKLKLLY